VNSEELTLRAEIRKLKQQNVQLIKDKLALQNERDLWKKRHESMSVSRLKTVRIRILGQD
jgi:hypothetical protein